ncbi:MAG: hypothetical protein RJA25_2061, partial [Bacteroidota bacterium]
MKNITYIILLILIAVTNGKGQTPISGTINPSSVINNVGRNFTG